jgi:very-short-patch-repair endonuclease
MTLRSLQRLAERQHGVVTWGDLDDQLDASEIRTALRRGWIVSHRHGVYRLAGSAPSWHQAVMAAVLAGGAGAAASHATAAALWRLTGFRPGAPIAITVPRGRRPRLDDVVVHATSCAEEVGRCERIPVTSVPRTIFDVTGALPDAAVERLVDDALVRKLTTVAELGATYEMLRGGRRSVRKVGRVLAARGDEAAKADSHPEARLVRWLREAGLPEPEQQHRVDAYRIDLAYPSRGLLIEYDGFEAHTTRSAFDADRRRQNSLVLSDDQLVLRVTSASRRAEVVRDVTRALARRAA